MASLLGLDVFVTSDILQCRSLTSFSADDLSLYSRLQRRCLIKNLNHPVVEGPPYCWLRTPEPTKHQQPTGPGLGGYCTSITPLSPRGKLPNAFRFAASHNALTSYILDSHCLGQFNSFMRWLRDGCMCGPVSHRRQSPCSLGSIDWGALVIGLGFHHTASLEEDIVCRPNLLLLAFQQEDLVDARGSLAELHSRVYA
ncbi:hypothetical protein DL95DRAFT_140952 [Leptodontidium sp. 2 PMI_412]|nr:hypothetical protein DL95DRAFT_140952 [Leptodontidium sp. 2 PMI_412]